MAKLGVITDGISREFEHALSVMNEFGLTHAELQYLWDREVGDLDDKQMDRVQHLVMSHEVEVSCISRHIFGGLLVGAMRRRRSGISGASCGAAPLYRHGAGAGIVRLVRIMAFRKETILFGSYAADQWNVATGAWDKLRALVTPAVQIAEDRGITLVVETGNNAMITSAYLARKLIDELGSARLQVLWDPANSLYCTEVPCPDGYELLRGGYLGHVHLKDVVVEIAKATLTCKPLGSGKYGDISAADRGCACGGRIRRRHLAGIGVSPTGRHL